MNQPLPNKNESVFVGEAPDFTGLRKAISEHYLCDEQTHLTGLMEILGDYDKHQPAISALATQLVTKVRAESEESSPIDAFMQQYDLSSEEGVLLMCLAEALLRIPDSDTADKLIADKLGEADWEAHLGKSRSLFVNASTWGLMLTGRMVRVSGDTQKNFKTTLRSLVARSGEPVVRQAVRQAMRVMGHQYVMGRTIEDALKRSQKKFHRQYRHSFDMLGEAALTQADANRYFESYLQAIRAIGARRAEGEIHEAPSISIKLSALHPRYEMAKRERLLDELVPRVAALVDAAKAQSIAVTVDAEEADRLRISLDVFAAVYEREALEGYEGFGLVVQAYQKRAPKVIEWLSKLASENGRRIPIRLVKGAYWDTEIKRAQEDGLEDYPVFTRKPNTDVSYLACARMLLDRREQFYPQFATHNAHTVAAIYEMAGSDKRFEFQRLHGMGEELYGEVIGPNKLGVACRVYAPVGSHEDLLPYLVRRLLENGANTSFVNRIVDADLPISEIVSDPVLEVRDRSDATMPAIPKPADIYGAGRKNSMGVNLASERELLELQDGMNAHPSEDWAVQSLVPNAAAGEVKHDCFNPADRRMRIGSWTAANEAAVEQALQNATSAFPAWEALAAHDRAQILDSAADALQAREAEFMALLCREAGKTIPDGVAEVREAIDFCRYYAQQARSLMGQPTPLPGPTGESNHLSIHGRGVFVCISPWNFPLAIFMGQVVAALVTGNTVIAKPAEQTPIVAFKVVKLLHEAGVPEAVLQLLLGSGADVGAALTSDARVAGVAFTGSTQTAHAINRSLAARNAPIGTLIAETGGQNAMIADSSALPEQLVDDVISSAFHSAGQRCSALRVLYIQQDIADKVIEMLSGAMDELNVGDPARLATDLGPVIDQAAQENLLQHVVKLENEAKLLAKAPLPDWAQEGTFVAPAAFEIQGIGYLEKENFGPLLHVVRYKGRELDQVIDAINGTGFGLTLGIHSRIESTVDYIASRARVGNIYVNRNMIGAVVGVQPFGGMGLSGTGPKAGGPHYLTRFVTEKTRTVNTAAIGGNASLLAMAETTHHRS